MDGIAGNQTRAAVAKLSKDGQARYEELKSQGYDSSKALALAQGKTVTFALNDPNAPKAPTLTAVPGMEMSDDSIPEIVSNAPRWRLGEEVLYRNIMTSSMSNLWGRPSEDSAAAQAQNDYNNRNANRLASMLVDGFTPYGQGKAALSTAVNTFGKAVSGYAAALGGAIGDIDTATSWQKAVSETIRLDFDSPLGEMMARGLAPDINRLQVGMESKLGVGGAAFVNAGAEALLDTATVLGAGLAMRSLGSTAQFAPLMNEMRAPLAYDVSKWGDYGLPSDGYFARTLTRDQYLDFTEELEFEFAGKSVGGYPNGMGFIGSAEEVRGIMTTAGYKDALQLGYEPKYVLEFQLRDPAGLQNVIKAPYAEFVPGGRTGAGFAEWNYPGIGSTDIVNPRVRVLK